MSAALPMLKKRLKDAIKHFWTAREKQVVTQGGNQASAKDRGARGAVTGGKQMDGFVGVIYATLVEAGLSDATIFCRRRSADSPKKKSKKKRGNDTTPSATSTKLPGWFRPEKDWDLLVVVERNLIAAIEFKSHVGSFGNNFNNRCEEALGSATDIWAAFREGAFAPSMRPWLGYLMLLEDVPGSNRPIRPNEAHFKVFPEFRNASYSKRYDILITKLVRERLYDAGCFLTSTREDGIQGKYKEPNAELSFANFTSSLMARAIAVAKTQPPGPPTPPAIVEEGED